MAAWTGRELLAMTATTPDAMGECDCCHKLHVALYEIDADDPAGWLYCRACLRVIAVRKIRQERTVT